MFYAGLDTGKRHSYLAVVDERGRTVRQGRVESTPEGLLASLSGLGPELRLALEATRAWEWAYDLLSDQGLEVTLVHPYKTKAIASARPGKRPAGRPHPGPKESGQTWWKGPTWLTRRPGACGSCCATGPSW